MAIPSFNLVGLIFVILNTSMFGKVSKVLSLKVLVEGKPRPYTSPFPPAPGPPEMSGYQNVWMLMPTSPFYSFKGNFLLYK